MKSLDPFLKLKAAACESRVPEKMSAYDYFFINHTKKEFCWFDSEESIIHNIELAVYKNVGWEMTDDIRVQAQLADDTALLDYLSENDYRNADMDGPTESEPDSEPTVEMMEE